MRLKSHVTVSALLRRAQAAGLFATVVHKGDPDGGLIWLKLRAPGGVRLFAETQEGRFVERTPDPAEERAADEAVRRERDFDRDLWLIEVEGEGGEALLET